MLGFICRKLKFLASGGGRNAAPPPEDDPAGGEKAPPPAQGCLTGSLAADTAAIRAVVAESSDFICRPFAFGGEQQGRGTLFYIDGLVEKTLVDEAVLRPLMLGPRQPREDGGWDMDYIMSSLLFVSSVTQTEKVADAVQGILSGDTVLLAEGSLRALVISLRGWKMRGIDEPETESVVRGPREGFTETLRVNTALLRRKLKNPDLVFETVRIGARTRTDVCIAYIRGLTNPHLLADLRTRLGRINTDAILESGYIEQFIEDDPRTIFPTIGNSEKPDKVAAKMLEGRAAILVDGTPFVLTVPMLFFESFQSAEDYYSRPVFASLIRLLRFLAFFISVTAPAVYVALSTFHQELLPTPLLLTMAAAHEGVPFPAALEAAFMIVAFEILKEAGVRLPRPVGQAVSIVGALVIGEAAVSAGLIGAPMVIVVAITAVASFVVPPQTDSGAVIRFGLLLLGGFMGGFGIAIGLLAVFVHMASLRSFGAPYLSGLAPFRPGEMGDTFIRGPLWRMKRRPADLRPKDSVRQGPGQRPGPPAAQGET